MVPINFKDVVWNKGSAYNITTKVFTAPFSGIYHFELQAQSWGDRWNHVAITGFPETKFIKSQGQAQTGGSILITSATIPLRAGEKITATMSGEIYCPAAVYENYYDANGHRYCRFAGFLVTPIE
jgi:hypothetical protein